MQHFNTSLEKNKKQQNSVDYQNTRRNSNQAERTENWGKTNWRIDREGKSNENRFGFRAGSKSKKETQKAQLNPSYENMTFKFSEGSQNDWL